MNDDPGAKVHQGIKCVCGECRFGVIQNLVFYCRNPLCVEEPEDTLIKRTPDDSCEFWKRRKES